MASGDARIARERKRAHAYKGAVANRSVLCYTADVSRTIPQRELRNQNAQVLAAVEAGATFVVTRHGEPIAELRPLKRRRSQYVPKADIAALVRTAPHIDATLFRRDTDAVIDQRLDHG